MPWPANKILQHLQEVDASVSAQEIATATGLSTHKVYMSADVLVKNRLATREARGVYIITEAGRAAIAEGKGCKSGPKGVVGHRSRLRLTFRQRLWNALRIEQKGTLGHFVSLILREEDREKPAMDNAKKYFSILCRAGYLAKLPGRAKGTAPTSNGYVRYLLVENSGPKAPRLCTDSGRLFDPNTGKTIELKREVPNEP